MNALSPEHLAELERLATQNALLARTAAKQAHTINELATTLLAYVDAETHRNVVPPFVAAVAQQLLEDYV